MIPWYAKSIKGWSVEDVSAWLAAARMPHLQDTFARKKVDGPKLLKIGKISNVAEKAKRYQTTKETFKFLQRKVATLCQDSFLSSTSGSAFIIEQSRDAEAEAVALKVVLQRMIAVDSTFTA